jgi:GTP pyrophosphokinase
VDIEKVLAQYRDRWPTYDRFTSQMCRLFLNDLLPSIVLDPIVTARTKHPDHFREKINRPGKSYTDPLTRVTDLTGLRIVVQRQSDAVKVLQLLEREFEIDRPNSIFPDERLSVDQFGYSSPNVVVSLTRDRLRLSEWASFAGLKAEVQVRTELQNGWAQISRRFDYKSELDIPREFRRRLFRLSALFELVDDELDDLVDEASRAIEAYKKALSVGDRRIDINVDSLRTYIEQSPEIRYWQDFWARAIGIRGEGIGDLSRDVKIAEFCGLSTMEDINSTLVAAHGWGEEFFSRFYQEYFARYSTNPANVSVVASGVITMLLIGAYIEKFTDKILAEMFGWGTTFIIDAARRSRRIT